MKQKNQISIKRLTAADFPPAVRAFWSSVENNAPLRLALTLVAICCYCVLSPRLRVKYLYDKTLSMLLLNVLVIGPSGSGKSLVRWVVNMLMAPQILRDDEERCRMREYRDACKRKGSNKDKGEEPLVIIRFLQKFTLPVVVKYADLMRRRYKDWLPFFLYSDELATFTENRRGNGDFQAVARASFGLGEKYSRDTLYLDGYNASVDINWCSVMCGQEPALDKYIDKNGVVLGDAMRHILVMMGDSLGEDAPVVRDFSEDQQRDIDNAVARLMAETFTDDDQLMPTHMVDMAWMDKDVKQWCEQMREIVLKNGSRAMESFYKRSSVSAFRIATMLYHLWGEDPDHRKNVRRCYLFFAQMILDAAMAKWGQTYEAAMPKDSDTTAKKPSLYDIMPEKWTRDQLRQVIVKEELTTPARVFISKWLKKKWIYEVQKDLYEKIYK